MSEICFVYLDIGRANPPHLRSGELAINLEIQYSLATLLAETASPFSIVIYTDKPGLYANYPVETVDVADIAPALSAEGTYLYRAKPCVLLDAVRKKGGVLCFLDSDTYILPALSRRYAL